MKCSLEPIKGDCRVAAEIEQINQRLQYLICVIQHLSVARDLESIMAAVRTGARQLTGADGATFVLREQDQCYYADEDAISPLWKGQRFPMSACISGWVMLHQQTAVIEDIYADPRIPVDAYRPTFVKSLVMVPIRPLEPLGAIGTYWATHHTPSSQELELLQTLADTAAVALDNVRLYEEQEQRIHERTAQLEQALAFEALLKRITDRVRDSLDERQVLTAVMHELSQGLKTSQCNAFLYDFEHGTAMPYEALQPADQMPASSTLMAHFPDVYGQLLQGETLQYCSWPQSRALPHADKAQLILRCPIVDDQRTLGDVQLYRPADHPFEPLEVRLVQQVANQCAIALRQARLHAAMQAQVHELERLNQLKDDFLSTISHELRSPMTSIKMAVQMLSAIFGVVNGETVLNSHTEVSLNQFHYAKAVHYLQILNDECKRETNLINDLLDLTRLEAETAPVIVEAEILQDWLSTIVSRFEERAQRQQQQLSLRLLPNLTSVNVDLVLLERVLAELLQNACTFTPTGETITVSAQTEHTISPTENGTFSALVMTVSNTGVELSESDRASIFDKFYRIPNSDPWKHGGTGLGLAVVKRLVEWMGGSIEVSSENNQVCFTLKL